MRIIMLRPTRYQNKFYSRGVEYEVTEATGKRWTRKRIAVPAPVEDAVNEAPSTDKPELVEPENEPEENNGEPSLKDLKIIAKAEGIKGYSKMSKEELTEILHGNNNA